MLNKELKKDILKIILFTVSLIFLFIYIKPVWEFLGVVFNLIMPFLVGVAIAFVLNILVNLLERKLFNKTKINSKTKHNLSIILSLAVILSFLTFMILLIVPQIKNTTNLFIDNMPTYQENVINLLDKVGVNNEIR